MRTCYFIAALISYPLIALSQPSDILIEACNAFPDAAKRLECLKSAMAKGQSSSENPASSLKKSFIDMRAGLSAGISYNGYQSSIIELSKSIENFKQNALIKNPESFLALDNSLRAYKDAGILWVRSIEFFTKNGNSTTYRGGLPIRLTDSQWIVDRYNLATVKADVWGIETGIDADAAREKILALAKDYEDSAFDYLDNRSSVTKTKNDLAPQSASSTYMEFSGPALRTAVTNVARSEQCHPKSGISPEQIKKNFALYVLECQDGTILKISCSDGACRASSR